MCFESYLKLTENPLTEQSKLIQLETRNKTQAHIIGDVIREKNKAKKEYEKQTQTIKANLKNHYNQNLRNLRKENRELNKQRNTIKQKYNNLLRLKKIGPNDIIGKKKIDELISERNKYKNKYKNLKTSLEIKPNHIPVSRVLRFKVFKRDNYTCQRCGKKDDLTLDHIKPRLQGGENSLDNLQVLCKSCNIQKGASVVDFRDNVCNSLIIQEAK